VIQGHVVNIDKYLSGIEKESFFSESGKITKVIGFLMEGHIPGAWLGTVCEVFPSSGEKSFFAEVVGFRERNVLLMPLGDLRGIGMGARDAQGGARLSLRDARARSRSLAG
jgi:flagellum-specific ATP synthase